LQLRKCGAAVRAVKSAGAAEIAVNAVFRDECRGPVERAVALLQNFQRGARAGAFRQCRNIRLDAGADLPAIARAAAPAGVFGIQHQSVAVRRGLDGRAQAGVAAADDEHIGGARQGGLRGRRARRALPPKRRFLEIFGEMRGHNALF